MQIEKFLTNYLKTVRALWEIGEVSFNAYLQWLE